MKPGRYFTDDKVCWGGLSEFASSVDLSSAMLNNIPITQAEYRQKLRGLRAPFLIRCLGDRFVSRHAWNLFWLPRNDSDERCNALRVNIQELDVTADSPLGTASKAAVRVTVCFIDASERVTSFCSCFREIGVRKVRCSNIRGLSHITQFVSSQARSGRNSELDFIFDLSALLTFLRRFPRRVELYVDVYRESVALLEAREMSYKPALRSQVCLYDAEKSVSPWVRHVITCIPLESVVQHGVPEIKNKDLVDGRNRSNSHSCRGTNASRILNADERRSQCHILSGKDSMKSKENEAKFMHRVYGLVIAAIQGGPTWRRTRTREVVSTQSHRSATLEDGVHIRMLYKSPDLPLWEGIVRHDFICPWCHYRCVRLRALFMHFQVDHRDVRLMLDSQTNGPASMDIGSSGELRMSLDVKICRVGSVMLTAASTHGRSLCARKAEAPTLRNVESAALKSVDESQDSEVEDLCDIRCSTHDEGGLEKVSESSDVMTKVGRGGLTSKLDCTAESNVIGSGSEQGDSASIGVVARGKVCAYCNRCVRNGIGCDDGLLRGVFCSEWCEMLQREICWNAKHQGDMRDDVGLNDGSVMGLSRFSRAQERNQVEFCRAFAGKTLYHVVSVAGMTEDHLDARDEDSEDEVDDCWRLQLSEDDILGIDGLRSKQKVLWILWNRYMFHQKSDGGCGPSGGAYGNRYTLYGVELFTLAHADILGRLGLRVEFCAFLRALHVHGMIDGKGVLQALACLDGHRKRRQCMNSGGLQMRLRQ